MTVYVREGKYNHLIFFIILFSFLIIMDVRVAAQVIYTLAYCVCVFFLLSSFLPSFWIDSNIIYIYFFLDPYRAGRSRLKTEHPHI